MAHKFRKIILKLGLVIDIGMESDVIGPFVRINRPAIPGDHYDRVLTHQIGKHIRQARYMGSRIAMKIVDHRI